MNLPKNVKITEVGPRDGFQSISEWIPTELKLEIIEDLIAANFKKIEITSFVNPKAIPQLSDAKTIVASLIDIYGERDVIFNALVPNLFGAKAAYEAGLREITYVISASVSHNMANVKRTKEQSFEDLKNIKNQFGDLKINLAVGTAFGCPYEGDISFDNVSMMVENGLNLGVDEISLADTIGIANPLQMEKLLNQLKARFGQIDFTLHLHDTRGMGLANVLVALECGVKSFESSLGGLGGCPFAPGAAGNIASEDLINMLENIGVKTGIDLALLLKTVNKVKEKIKSSLSSHLAHVDTCSKGEV